MNRIKMKQKYRNSCLKASQAEGRGFESRFPLQLNKIQNHEKQKERNYHCIKPAGFDFSLVIFRFHQFVQIQHDLQYFRQLE